MGKGGYLGGSTVVRVHPKASGKGGARGILALETEYAKTGAVGRESLLPQAPKKASTPKTKSKGPKAVQPASKPPARPSNPSPRQTSTMAPDGVYSLEAIKAYTRKHHPNCKGPALKRVAKLGAQGRWTGMALHEVVASCMEQHLLYEVFSLPGLVACGYSQEHAVKMLSPLVCGVLSDWGAKPVWLVRGKI